jgi:hypothetical protein
MTYKSLLSFKEFLAEGLDFTPQGHSDVPTPKQSVSEIVASPRLNVAYKSAKKFNPAYNLKQEHPQSSLLKQYVIGKTMELMQHGSPEYKQAVFNGYKEHSSSSLGGTKTYDDFVDASYKRLSKDTNRQFDALPVKLHFHDGEADYKSSGEMVADVHKNRNLNVFRGGDSHSHDVTDTKTGLTFNQKFRAVHDFYGHAIHNTQFGPKGEEAAWNSHRQLYSDLAAPTLTAETRGQNSQVNYTPMNLQNLVDMKHHRTEANKAKQAGDTHAFNLHTDSLKRIGSNWNYAPQKGGVLPHEMNDPSYNGEVPKSVKELLKDPRTVLSKTYDSKADHLGIVGLAKHYHQDEWEDVATKLAKVHGFNKVSKLQLNEDDSDIGLHTVSPKDFITAIKPSLSTQHGSANLTDHPESHYNKAKKLVLSKDHQSGYAIFHDGEFGNLFSRVKGRGDTMVHHAVTNNPGAHGNAYEGVITDLYKKHGAKEVRREKNWTVGQPDVVHVKF